jgi:putative protease
MAHIPELLSPAGDWDAMRAAVANGADAVYFGLTLFNARHRAANFKQEELPEIMAYLHAHNVKGFLTFNTLIFSDELPAAADYIQSIAAAGVDAVIVQDLGLCRLIREMSPGLPIHGSTQMTLTEPRGIDYVRKLGVSRVVLARELSVDDILKVASKASTEVEVFIHGALCVAYSGQCLTSESFGGRSANRGQCAQACRQPYDLIVDGQRKDLGDKAYLLSPQDLAAYDLVADLTRAGVSCFKIEGRLKGAHYVAATTQTYRAAIDAAATKTPFALTPQLKGDLEQTFSRGLAHGFLDGTNHQALVTARFPKSRGRRAGTVLAASYDGVLVQLEPNIELRPGDGIVFDEGHPERDEQGGRVFQVKPMGTAKVLLGLGHGDVNPAYLNRGAIVWKTDDPQLRKRLEHSFARETVARRAPVTARLIAHVGRKPELELSDGTFTATAKADDILQPARKHPLTADLAREQVARLGDTPFELTDLTLETSGGPMLPKSVLNDLRRDAAAQLLAYRQSSAQHAVSAEGILDRLRQESAGKSCPVVPQSPQLHVLVRSLAQLRAALAYTGQLRPTTVYCDFEDVRLYKDAVRESRAAAVQVGLGTIRIVKPAEDGFLRQVIDNQPDVLLVRNLASIAMAREMAPHLPLIADYSLNIANELTASLMVDTGVVRMVPSYDLNWRQMAALFSRIDPRWFEVVIHQHMPMFHMEHCVFAHTLSTGKDYRDCGRPCETHHVELRDHKGVSHPLMPDVGCRNTLFNGQPQSAADHLPRMKELGLRHYRIEMLRESPEELSEVLSRYERLLLGNEQPQTVMRSLRVLHQLGVAGTLEHD